MSANVLGLPLERAVELLAREGYTVRVQEVSSRKGMPGNEKRVVRRQDSPAGERETTLTYAVFQTDIS